MANLYTPGAGFAQSTYFDQMATALPGSLAFASDINLVDSAIVDPEMPAHGLLAGVGVIFNPIPAENMGGARPGMNQYYATLPHTGNEVSRNLWGITVRNQQMATNSDGEACWFAGQACNVLRIERVGGRIWVRLVHGSSRPGGTIYWIVSDASGHGHPIGSFSTEHIGSDTVELSGPAFCGYFDASEGPTVALTEWALPA